LAQADIGLATDRGCRLCALGMQAEDADACNSSSDKECIGDGYEEEVSDLAQQSAGARHKRAWCEQCDRPQRVCICDALPHDAPLATKMRVVIFLHPKEEKRKLGTAPLLKLCLQNLIVKRADAFPAPEEDPQLHAHLTSGGNTCVLVCPGPDAEVLRAPPLGEESDTDQPPKSLIFVDGTWGQAKGMVHKSPWLQSLPRVVLCPTEQSGYYFRQQPQEGCLSTLEAVAEALHALEGSRGPLLKEALLRPFQRMVSLQCPFIPGKLDKNAGLGEDDLPLFLPEQHATVQEHTGQVQYCVVRWGHIRGEQREVVVTQLVMGQSQAKHAAEALSHGRARGMRFWAIPLSKVPPTARCEEALCLRNARLGA